MDHGSWICFPSTISEDSSFQEEHSSISFLFPICYVQSSQYDGHTTHGTVELSYGKLKRCVDNESFQSNRFTLVFVSVCRASC